MGFAITLNAFIIFYSCIDEATTNVWNRAVTNLFTRIINNFTSKEIETTPLEKIEIKLSGEKEYKYNYIPGYETNEIPLGSAKQIECIFLPNDATNKAITYSTEQSDIVTLNQSGSLVSVVGLKVGNATITAKSSDGSFVSSVEVKIVNTVEPQSYELSLDKTEIAIGTTQTLNIDVDGGNLGHNELINFRYYDNRLLTYDSSNLEVASIDEYGVIYPKTIGSSTITVSNSNGFSKSIDISVKSGSIQPNYSNLSINGSDVCYANDMILDQNSDKNHYQLIPMDGAAELNPEDFIWESSNELLVKVDKHGVMRGFRKASLEDETAIITAKSKLTGQTATFNVTVKNQLPTELHFWIEIGDKKSWNKKEYTVYVGDNVYLGIYYPIATQNKNVTVNSSNIDVVSFTNEGSNIRLHALKEGSSNITIQSELNPTLVVETKIIVAKQGAISGENYESVNHSLRKTLGHASLFGIAQIFTYLTFYMFFYEKKWWFYSSISLGSGLLLACLSELIQFFVPTRSGAFLDVLIDFAGVVVAALIIFAIIRIVLKIKNIRNEK